MKSLIVLLIILSLMIIGCKEKENRAGKQLPPPPVSVQKTPVESETSSTPAAIPVDENLKKLDHELGKAMADTSVNRVEIFVKCDTQITDKMKKNLQETGLEINSIINETSTARCSKEVLYEVIKLDFVVYLQLAKKLEALDNNTNEGGSE